MDTLIALGVVAGGAVFIYFWLNGEDETKIRGKEEYVPATKDERAYIDALVKQHPELAKVGDRAVLDRINRIMRQDCDNGMNVACKLWNKANPKLKYM